MVYLTDFMYLFQVLEGIKEVIFGVDFGGAGEVLEDIIDGALSKEGEMLEFLNVFGVLILVFLVPEIEFPHFVVESEGFELFVVVHFVDFLGDDALQAGGEDELVF